MPPAGWSSALAAVKYERWLSNGRLSDAARSEAVAANDGVADAPLLRLPLTLAMAARGAKCFDIEFYLRSNVVSESKQRFPFANHIWRCWHLAV